MARSDYLRRDVAVSIGARLAAVTVAAEGESPVTRELRAQAEPADVAREIAPLLPPPAAADEFVISRLTVACDAALAAIDWESALAPVAAARVIVRVSPVRPRVADIDPTFPMRLLEVGNASRIAAVVDGVSRKLIPGRLIVAASTPLSRVEPHLREERWATADVLHFVDLLAEVAPADALRTARIDQPGTLGWIERIADRWQTRLVILEHAGEPSPLLRRVAATLVDRGGPAVLLVPAGLVPWVYAEVVHDRPLDWISWWAVGLTLFAGEQREELLRYSIIPALLARREVVFDIANEMALRPAVLRKDLHLKLSEASARIAGRLPNLKYESRESDGFVPSKELVDIAVEATTPASAPAVSETSRRVRITRGGPRGTPLEQGGVPRPRYVNSGLFRSVQGGELERLDQRTALRAGELVHLGIQIGPADELVKTVGRIALLEEQLRWQDRDDAGVWVEVAVAELDFELRGAAVQRLWLPRADSTDRIFFAVAPRACTTIPGVARLRFIVYYGNHVVQSGRLAALLAGAGMPAVEAAAALARALDVPAKSIDKAGEVAWLSAIEYAGLPLRAVGSAKARGLSIVANESAGQKVFTLKGDELFEVAIDANVPVYVGDLRTTLRGISAQQNDAAIYRYRFGQVDNDGDPAALAEDLFKLAALGWQLFSAIAADGGAQERVEEILGGSEEVIQVAQVAMGDTVPWSLIYDREIDPQRTQVDDGVRTRPAAHALCPAAWPAPDGKLPVLRCGTSPSCLLHPAQIAARAALPASEPGLASDTVVCPLRFWGYKHQIEVPVKLTRNRDDGDREPPPTAKRARPARIAAAINRRLPLYGEHEQRLTSLLGDDPQRAVLAGKIVDRRQAVKELLANEQPDIVYLYCHAFPRRELQGTFVGPSLGFGKDDSEELIAAANLTGAKWQRGPLVFLNGCSTLGFNPYAPSPFVVQFVLTRGASAVVGTEVTVWEILAAAVAEEFLRRFLGDESAGSALRAARRMLLRKHNPLGLVYTLYGAADLSLDA